MTLVRTSVGFQAISNKVWKNAILHCTTVATDQRNSHEEYFKNRNWSELKLFWPTIIKNECLSSSSPSLESTKLQLPVYDTNYSITALKSVHLAGSVSGEFQSKDTRYQKKLTYAMRIGYDGTQYWGYQIQPGDLLTVEGELKSCLKHSSYGAGRTDKGVSAISQVIAFQTVDKSLTPQLLLNRINDSDACRAGRLYCYECYRVPKKFNPRSSAVWRRYLYLFPLNKLKRQYRHHQYDVDLVFLNTILSKIVNTELPFNAFASGEDRVVGQGMLDVCTIYVAHASIIQLKDDSTSDDGNACICIELVGSRFLRKMVRILCGTALRESSLINIPNKDDEVADNINAMKTARNENVLVDICNSNNRRLASVPLPSESLCLAGVGYDALDLALYKYMPKSKRIDVLGGV